MMYISQQKSTKGKSFVSVEHLKQSRKIIVDAIKLGNYSLVKRKNIELISNNYESGFKYRVTSPDGYIIKGFYSFKKAMIFMRICHNVFPDSLLSTDLNDKNRNGYASKFREIYNYVMSQNLEEYNSWGYCD